MTVNSGIYKIQSIRYPKRIYIGSAINLKRREKEHFRRLKVNEHPNIILQRHFNKYGKEDLIFTVIEIAHSSNDLIQIEQSYLDKENPHFNICKTAGSSKGRAWTQEAKDKRKRNRERKIKETGLDPLRPSEHSRALMRKSHRKLHGETKDVENGFKIISETIKHEKRHVIAKCLHCQESKLYNLQALRKRTKKNCGCIKVATKPIPSIPKVGKSPHRSKKMKNNKSGWSGVSYDKCVNKYRGTIDYKGKKIVVSKKSTCPTIIAIYRDRKILELGIDYPTQMMHHIDSV